MKKTICVLSIILVTATLSFAQNSILGKWKTIDDNSGEIRSIVEIYERDNAIFGKVIKLFPQVGEDTDPICDECDEDDPRYNKKVMGMVIVENMKKDDDEYTGGKILDPENGNVYRCKMWRENNTLFVRGYLGFFYRTQEWHIVK